MPALAPLRLGRTLPLVAVDAVIPIAALALVIARHDTGWRSFAADAALLLVLTLLLFPMHGVYRYLHRGDLPAWIGRVLLGWMSTASVFMALQYLLRQGTPTSLMLVGLWAALTALVLVFSRILLYRVMVYRHKRGISVHNVLLVGDQARCRRLARHLVKQAAIGFRPVGIVTDARMGNGRGDLFPVVGSIDELPALVERCGAHRVLIVGALDSGSLVERVYGLLYRQPVTIQFAPDFARLPITSLTPTDYAGQPVIDISDNPLSELCLVLKRLEDIFFGLVALILVSPIMIVTAIAVKLTSPGPVLFVQNRHGLYGRPIKVYKFRSMRQDFTQAATGGNETTPSGRFNQAKKDDPRITPIGRFIRKTSIDELPQLINVIQGRMSLVGPRPHPLKLNDQFSEPIRELMQRHYLKPGITGLAQISGARGETRDIEDMRKRVHYDLQYIRNWTLLLDLKILVLTPFKGLFNLQP